MTHPFTTLPGYDPSKIRIPDCITASASEALDVRVLRVAEWIMQRERYVIRESMRADYAAQADKLREIAAEIRDAATSPRPIAECNEIIAIWNTDTVTQLRDVWAGSSARRPEMEPVERIRLLEKAMGRLLVIEARHEGDGR